MSRTYTLQKQDIKRIMTARHNLKTGWQNYPHRFQPEFFERVCCKHCGIELRVGEKILSKASSGPRGVSTHYHVECATQLKII